MLGGILKIFKGSMAELGMFMVIVFFVWFMIKVTQSYKEDLQYFKCDQITKKLPLYRQAMKELKKQMNISRKDMLQIDEDLEKIRELLGEENILSEQNSSIASLDVMTESDKSDRP